MRTTANIEADGVAERVGEQRRGSGRDAFISYRHDVDGDLAIALKQALERFAKPWYRRRALSVFLDNANLGAVDDLPARIDGELTGARFLVLLACPESASSKWVTREVLFWCEHKGTSNLLVVLTGGDLTWDDSAGRFADTSTALNAAVRHRLATEARFVDLRWARTEPELSLRQSRFRSNVADIASPIRALAPEELESEDLRLHRRAVRLARAAVVAIACLAIVAVIAAAVATANERKADRRAREALGRQLGLASLDLPASEVDRAFLLSLVAADLDKGGKQERFRAGRTLIGRYSRLDELLYAGEASTIGVRGVAIAPDGDTVVATAWRDDGTGDLVSWPRGRSDPVRTPLPRGLDPSISARGPGPVVLGVPGQTMALIGPAGSLRPIGDHVVAVDQGSSRAVTQAADGSFNLLDLEDGSTVAVLPASAGVIDLRSTRLAYESGSRLVLVDADDGRQVATSPPAPPQVWRALAVGTGDEVAAVSAASDGSLIRWRREGDRLVPAPSIPPMKEVGTPTRLVPSPDGRRILAVGDDGAALVDLTTGATTVLASGPVGQVMMDPSGTYAAFAGERLAVWDLRLAQRVFAVPKPANALAWSGPCASGARCRLVSAGESIDVWEPEDSRHIELADQTNAQAVAISADGMTVVTAGWGSSVAVWKLELTDDANRRPIVAPAGRVVTADPATGELAWSDGTSAVNVDHDGRTVQIRTGPVDRAYLVAASSRLLTAQAGELRLWDTSTGEQVRLDDRCSGAPYAISPSGGVVAAHEPATGVTVVCDTSTGQLVAGAKVSGAASPAAVVAVDDNGDVALGGSDGYVVLLPRRDQKFGTGIGVDVRQGGEPAVVTAIALRRGVIVAGVELPDHVAPQDEGGLARVLIWDVARSGTPVQFETDHRHVQAVALLGADADHLVVAGRDEPSDPPLLQVWETATRRRLGRTLPGLRGEVVALGGSATKVVAADDEGHAYTWSLDEDPKGEICQIVGRGLTRDEWDTVADGALADRSYSPECP